MLSSRPPLTWMKTLPRPNCEALFRSEEAPADSVSSCWKLRVANGRVVMVVDPSDSPVVASVVFTFSTCDCTSMTSFTTAALITAVMRVVSVMRTTTPGNLVTGNPAAFTSTV